MTPTEADARSPAELRAIEQAAHEEPTSTQDPSTKHPVSAIGSWTALFLLAVVLFFYSLGSC